MSQQPKISDSATAPEEPLTEEPLAVLRRERLDEQIVRILVDAVVAGRWSPGTALPPERDLAEQLSVNRTSLRLALARLEQIGLVRSRQGSGNVVQDPAELSAPEVVRAMMRQLGPEIVDEIIEVRTGLGALIGRLAAQRSTEAEIASLRSAADAVGRAAGGSDRQRAEMDFFRVLVAATHNQVLGALLRWVDATYGQLPDDFADAFDDPAELGAGLATITDAVADRDSLSAGSAVERYFERSGARLSATAHAKFAPRH